MIDQVINGTVYTIFSWVNLKLGVSVSSFIYGIGVGAVVVFWGEHEDLGLINSNMVGLLLIEQPVWTHNA